MMALYMIVMLWGYAGANGACNETTCKENMTHSKCENVTSNAYSSPTSKCVACEKDDDCAESLTCHVGECKLACDPSKMCPLEMPVCPAGNSASSAGYDVNSPTSFCTTCTADAECSRFQNFGVQHICSNGACTPCDANIQYADANSTCKFLETDAQCGEENFRMCGDGFACRKTATDAGYGTNTAESETPDEAVDVVSGADGAASSGTTTTTTTTIATTTYQTNDKSSDTTAVVPIVEITYSTEAPAKDGSTQSSSTTNSPATISVATTETARQTQPRSIAPSPITSGTNRRLEAGTSFCMNGSDTDFTDCTCQQGVFPTADEGEEGEEGEDEGSNLMLIIIIAAIVAVVVLIIIVAVVLANKKKDVNGKNEVNFQPASTDSNRVVESNRGVQQNHRGARRDGDRHRDANARAKNPNHANDSSSRSHVTLR